MAKNYESENKNSKNSTNRSYENEMNSQDCKEFLLKNTAAKTRVVILTRSGEDTTSDIKIFLRKGAGSVDSAPMLGGLMYAGGFDEQCGRKSRAFFRHALTLHASCTVAFNHGKNL